MVFTFSTAWLSGTDATRNSCEQNTNKDTSTQNHVYNVRTQVSGSINNFHTNIRINCRCRTGKSYALRKRFCRRKMTLWGAITDSSRCRLDSRCLFRWYVATGTFCRLLATISLSRLLFFNKIRRFHRIWDGTRQQIIYIKSIDIRLNSFMRWNIHCFTMNQYTTIIQVIHIK